MNIELNSRGNGACPICVQHNHCRIQKALIDAVKPFNHEETQMELVIYTCPYFKEKD